MLQSSYAILQQLRLPHGLYLASPSRDYSHVWIRDSFYMSLPFLDKSCDTYERTYHRIFDLFIEYEWKLNHHIQKKPVHLWEYIHSRYSADEVKEIHHQEWGHAQHDAIGAFLFGVGEGMRMKKSMIRNQKDQEILQKLVYYLHTIQYWCDPDNGMWEEWREIHASSVGACVAGLSAIHPYVQVEKEMIQQGIASLLHLYPRESQDKGVDLAQLSLIYPYQLFHGILGNLLIDQVEKKLLRSRGVIRYEGDSYYSTLEEKHGRNHSRKFYYGTEAEWCFGLPWLSLCYLEMGNLKKGKDYLQKTEEIMLEHAILPELYYSGTNIPNPNTPLGWSSAMYILAKEKYLKTLT